MVSGAFSLLPCGAGANRPSKSLARPSGYKVGARAFPRGHLHREDLMVVTVIGFLVVGAFATALASLAGKCPLVAPVLLLSLVELLRILPLGR